MALFGHNFINGRKIFMIKMNLNRGGKIGLLMLMVAAVLCVTASASFAVTDQTWLKTAAGGQVAAAGNCRFIAVAKGDDSYIMTEDDGGASYADSNGAYMAAGTTGFAKTDSTHWSTGWIVATDTYAIWVSSIADGQTGTASGTIGTTSPNYTTPGTNASQLSLATTSYMAAPGNFKAYAGDKVALLKWDAVTGATKYRIFKGPVTGNSNSLYSKVGTTTGLCYEDTSLTDGTAYYYIVVPMNGSNWYGVHANQLSVTPSATGAPTISLNPTTGIVGSSVTITGTNFGAAQGTGFVEFNGVVATVTSWSATSVVVTVPTGATTGLVCLVNSSNAASNGVTFTVSTPGTPSFTSITPSSGYKGDTLTSVAIVGANTNFVNGTTTVSISGSNVTVSNVTVTNSTHLTCDIAIAAGAAAGARDVVVTTGSEVVTGTGSFTVKAPVFTSISPASEAEGTTTSVTIVGTGTHFTGTPTVTFSGTGVTASGISVTDATHLTCNAVIVAVTALTARDVTVTTGSETVTGTGVFTVTSGAPTVTSVSPSSGASPATGITISGTNFNGVTGIVIGSTAITTYTVSSATSITGVSIPSGLAAGAYDIKVTNASGTSSVVAGDKYTVTPGVPTVTSVSPSSGASPNTGITISGTNFSGVTGIVIGSTAITTYTVSSATSITGVSIPSGLAAGIYDIQVTNSSGQSSITAGDKYTVIAGGGGNGSGIYEGAGGVMMAYPNPFNPLDKANPLKMLFNVATGEAVDIYIFDTNGRVIYQDRNSAINADRTVTWSGDTAYGETVDNGLYLIRVVNNGKLVAKGKILVIKN